MVRVDASYKSWKEDWFCIGIECPNFVNFAVRFDEDFQNYTYKHIDRWKCKKCDLGLCIDCCLLSKKDTQLRDLVNVITNQGSYDKVYSYQIKTSQIKDYDLTKLDALFVKNGKVEKFQYFSDS